MQKSDFHFSLPPRLIAQHPASPRDSSRLFCLGRQDGHTEHRHFYDLPALLRSGDVLVVNNSRVIPARLIGRRPAGGACELLLLREQTKDVWECLAKPGKRVRPGDLLVFGEGELAAEVLSTLENGGKLVRFTHQTGTLFETLDILGKMPLPPYIKAQLQDNADYQTVYAKTPGSAAAPTAGLHFTGELLEKLKTAGVQIAEVTLHVGLGTFLPVKEDEIERHVMHSEVYELNAANAAIIRAARANGGRVVAVGTTSCRTLESIAAANNGQIVPSGGETDIFIRPGYQFLAIDGLITNFHLPESTLIMLVAAFCGYENTMRAYEEAVKQEYRFFSFGDAMFII